MIYNSSKSIPDKPSRWLLDSGCGVENFCYGVLGSISGQQRVRVSAGLGFI